MEGREEKDGEIERKMGWETGKRERERERE